MLKSGITKTVWGAEDIAKSIELRCVSAKAFDLMREVWKIPLPSRSTILRTISKINFEPGIITPVLNMMKKTFAEAEFRDRQTLIGFDEMSIEYTICYDSKNEKIYGPCKKLLLVAMRGLFGCWKQPVYFHFDKQLSKELFFEIIQRIHDAGFNVVGLTCDLSTTNRGLLNELGEITEQTPFFTNPVTKEPVCVFGDFPHIEKLTRNNLFDHGFQLSNKKCITKRDYQELLAKNRTEFKVCYKLTQQHLDVKGKGRMNVRMAFETLSNSVAKAFSKYLPWKKHVSEFIELVNNASDILNSRTPQNVNNFKAGYGMKLEEQDRVLTEYANEVRTMRPLNEQGKAMNSMLPFQKYTLITIAALNMLYNQMNKFAFETKYILTARLNQDYVENMFGSIRGLGVYNQNPSPIECVYRLKSLVLSRCLSSPKTCSVAPTWEVNSFNTEIVKYLKEDDDVYSMEKSWADELSFAEGILEIDSYQPEIEEVNADNWENFLDTMTIDESSEFGVEEYFYGYIAKKLKQHIPDLEFKNSETRTASWTQHLSNGNLTTPSYDCLNLCRTLNGYFVLFHKTNDKWSLNRKSGVIKVLVAGLIAKFPDVDKKIIKLFVKARTFIRIKYINSVVKRKIQSYYAQRLLRSNAS